MEKVTMTKRAAAILDAVSKIGVWCDENLQDLSYKVFALRKDSDAFGWNDFLYSVKYQKIFFARGDHSRWGALDDSFQSGMTEDMFDYYMFKCDRGSESDYTRINSDGNLIFEDELICLIKGWESRKSALLLFMKEEEELQNFKA